MNTKAIPDPPEDLLDRCLNTIPASAKRTAGRSRMSLEVGSRQRLRWMSVAAAIPITAVLIVLPIRRFYQNRALSKATLVVDQTTKLTGAAAKLKQYRVFSDLMRMRSDASRDYWFEPSTFRLDIWDGDHGHWSAGYEKALGKPGDIRNGAVLETANGEVYTRDHDEVHLTRSSPEQFAEGFRAGVADLFDPVHMTTRISGYGNAVIHADGTREGLPVVVEKRYNGIFHEASPTRNAAIWVCTQRPPRELAQRGAPVIEVRYYRDPQTGLLYGFDAMAFWEDAKGHAVPAMPTRSEPMDIGGSTMDYAVEPQKEYGGQNLHASYMLENARVLSGR